MSVTYAAAIFDLDGTLVDNMAFHRRAWLETAAELGAELTPERFDREFAGKKNEDLFPLLLGRPLPAAEIDRLAAAKEARYRELYAPHVAPLRGARELLRRLRERGVRCAVATSAPPDNRRMVLDALAFGEAAFDAVIGGEHVTRGKPAPDAFLAAARALGAEPARCVVFEDAVSGVVASVRAGMAAVGVTTTETAEALRDAGARWTVAHFEELPAELGL